MKILLFDRDEILQGTLKNVVEAKHTEELNGENILEITTYDTQEIKKDYRIVYKDIYGYWHEFIIKGIEEIREDEGIKKQLFCESSFYETLGDYIDDKRPSGTANSALEVALQPTRWEVGQVDNLGTNKTNFYHISAKEAVQKVAEVWQGEIRTRITISGNKITGRYVDLYAQRGHDLGKRFTYTKDLESITRIIHRDDVITALYGYGKGEEIEDDEGNATGGFGRRIDFAEVNNGIPYVENNDARLIWGRNNPDGSKSHVFGKVEFDDCEDKEELLELTKEKLKELSKPLITYEAKVVDLKAFGVEHEGVELGDAVVVVDKEFEPELRVKARVVKITRDLLEPENNDITLGNFMPSITDTWAEQEEHINNFRGKQGVWDRSGIINPDGTIKASYLQDLIDELNKDMNSQGGYVYISEDGEGLTTYNKPIDQNPTMAIQLKGGGFRIANSKLPNGEWNWRTFGTGDGFVADYITTGIFNAGLIKTGAIQAKDGSLYINIDSGSFTIGGGSSDIAKHTNSYSRYQHADGSYSQIGVNGIERYIAGSGRRYHHLIHLAGYSLNSSSTPRWAQLPNEFKGKLFTVYIALADTMNPPSVNYSLYKAVVTGFPGMEIDHANARIPLIGYKQMVHKDSRELRTGEVQGLLIAIY